MADGDEIAACVIANDEEVEGYADAPWQIDSDEVTVLHVLAVHPNHRGKGLAEKQAAKEAVTAEIASITANIDALKADLKTKKAALKSIDKEIARIEAKKVKAETKAAESAKKS